MVGQGMLCVWAARGQGGGVWAGRVCQPYGKQLVL